MFYEKFEKITGYKLEDLRGKKAKSLLDSTQYNKISKFLGRSKFWEGEIKLFSKTNDIFWLSSKVFRYKDQFSKTRIMIISYDITA